MKAGIGLTELINKKNSQLDLFHKGQSLKSDRLMKTLDKLNQNYGRGSVCIGSEGVAKKWAMRQAYTSPAYTTRLTELPSIKCG